MENINQFNQPKLTNINETDVICIDEIDKRYKEIVTTNSLKTGETGPVITIKVPKGKKIKIVGITDPVLDDKNNAHTLVTRLSDRDDKAIDFMTKVTMTHEKSDSTVTISKLFYCDINMITTSTLYKDPDLTKGTTFYRLKTDLEWYRFKDTIILNEDEKLVINAISPNRNIEKIKFAIYVNIENM